MKQLKHLMNCANLAIQSILFEVVEMYIPNQLLKALNNDRCVVLIGSGLSSRLFLRLGKRYPNWTELLQMYSEYSFQQDIITHQEQELVGDVISKGNLTIAAQILKDKSNDLEFSTFLESVFNNGNQFDHIHCQIWDLPFSFVLTTNYDSILENAYSYKHNKSIPTYTNKLLSNVNKSISEHKNFLFKLHGSYEQSDTIIFTQNDYKKLYFNSAYIDTLKNIFINYSVLFIGFSYNDPDISSIVSSLAHEFNSGSQMHYLLCPNNIYNNLEKEYFKRKERITIIEYDNTDNSHSGVDDFFKELSSRSKKRHCNNS